MQLEVSKFCNFRICYVSTLSSIRVFCFQILNENLALPVSSVVYSSVNRFFLLLVFCAFKWIICSFQKNGWYVWENISSFFFFFFLLVLASSILIIASIMYYSNMVSCLKLAGSKLESDRVLRLIPEWSKSVRWWKLKFFASLYYF